MAKSVVIDSKALQSNIRDYYVEVAVDPKYMVLQDIMSSYFGLRKGLETFLKELSHPYKNWAFIIDEARKYALEYFHMLKNHPEGHHGAEIYLNVFLEAIESAKAQDLKTNAANNFLLFLQKIFAESGSEILRFIPVIGSALFRVSGYSDDLFFLFVKNYYQVNKLSETLLNHTAKYSVDFAFVNTLLIRYYRHTYSYWLSEKDPLAWFERESDEKVEGSALKTIFERISHKEINALLKDVDDIASSGEIDSRDTLKKLVALPGFRQFVDAYRDIPPRLFKSSPDKNIGTQRELISLFLIMNTSGLSVIHAETLREINRTLSWIIEHENIHMIRGLLKKTFSILKAQTVQNPVTALNCVENMGKGVYQTNDRDLVYYFLMSVIDLGFHPPMIEGVGNDWQVKLNSAHLRNIRTWLRLIEWHPKLSTRLLSSLIIYLTLCGVHIKDTDIFPRDISRLLNSDIEPVYNLIKQLTRIFPAYFNDIGAEGQLRDVSTDLDELTHRKDILIHFLRKQSHVESSNRILGFVENVLVFWKTKDKDGLSPYLPPDMWERIETMGTYIDGVNSLIRRLADSGFEVSPETILLIDENVLNGKLQNFPDVTDVEKKRLVLFVTLAKLLNQKYNLSFTQMDSYLAELNAQSFPNLADLNAALVEKNTKHRIDGLLSYLEMLKSLILSKKVYEAKEDIYQKRHFTVDIPSMYGSYHEMKFDALGLMFRIESILNVLLESYIESIDLSIITKATFFQIYDRLKRFDRALKLEGIFSIEFERQLDLLAHSLDIREFSFTQYLDIFKGFASAAKNIINFHINKLHEENLNIILEKIPCRALLPKYKINREKIDDERLKYRISEIFYRDVIASMLGLQQLDVFLSRILNTLFYQADKLHRERLHLLLNYDPYRSMTKIEKAEKKVSGVIYLGNKGSNLLKLKSFGLPVPPGFIVTTEVFRCREIIDSYRPAELNFKETLVRHLSDLEKEAGRKLGSTKKPLLLSVRSGSSISQPGMLDTYLNVGISEKVAEALAWKTRNPWFVWDNYRRFLQSYGMSYGLERDEFDMIIHDFKKEKGVPYKNEFTGGQMKEVALLYKKRMDDAGIEIVKDPFEQLCTIIKKVLSSWDSPKAKVYRKIMGISDDWGTAVTVQCMVFGNISRQSGSGVVFTHSPRSADMLSLWGDFSIQNQGEDVVSGLVQTLPISLIQREVENRDTAITLETHFPEIFRALKKWSNELFLERGWGPQEMEFTFEGPSEKDLYLLQARDMALIKSDEVRKFDEKLLASDKDNHNFPIRLLGHGIGISGGAMWGRIVFTLGEIDAFRLKEPDTPLILIRNDTVPDDIQEIFAADGLVTARGGVTSHASIVATRLQKTCVVGCENLVCNEKESLCSFDDILLHAGDIISIEGQEGSVYLGKLKIKTV